MLTRLISVVMLLLLLAASPVIWAQVAASAPANAVAPAVAVPVAVPAPNFSGNMLTMLLGLAAVLALMVGALWLLKQLTQRRGGPSALLKVVAGTAVGPRERVVIVEVGSTWLVLGVAPGRVTPLAEVPRQATAATVAAAFADNRRVASADLANAGSPPRAPTLGG
ncbi:MAG: flagellar biosynthetic protein FliO [Rhodocyclaceae bacterium]|jgi:flagellar protein FliO/FliZ|nr:flagellar biosynthetic protein FliO [Rhodocyclaceae bacterium]